MTTPHCEQCDGDGQVYVGGTCVLVPCEVCFGTGFGPDARDFVIARLRAELAVANGKIERLEFKVRRLGLRAAGASLFHGWQTALRTGDPCLIKRMWDRWRRVVQLAKGPWRSTAEALAGAEHIQSTVAGDPRGNG